MAGRLLTGPGCLSRVEDSWREILEVAPDTHLFHQPEWHKLWLELHKEHTPWVVALRQGGRLQGIAPFSLSRGLHFRLLPVRALQVLANDEPVHDNLLFGMEPLEGLRAVLRELSKRQDWDILTLNTKSDRETMTALCEPVGFRVADASLSSSPFLPLDATWAEFCAKNMKRKLRHQLRGREKKLAEHGGLSHEVVREPGEVDGAMERIFAVSRKGWAHEGSTAIGSTPELRRFHLEFARLAARRGWLYLHILRAGERDVAFEYDLLYKNVVYNLKSGYDQALSHGAPGHVLKRYALEDAIRRGAARYDMLGVAEEYKMKWTSATRRRPKWLVFNGTPYGRFLYRFQTSVWNPLRSYCPKLRQPLT